MNTFDWHGSTVVFVGDSVTDAGRTSAPSQRPFDGLGVGYVRFRRPVLRLVLCEAFLLFEQPTEVGFRHDH